MTGRETVAVVGGGCAGVLATRELLRRGDADVVLIEPGEPGGGLAYGAARPWHLLNSRAGAMSADPDDAGGFARWAGCDPADFRPRLEYGRYLKSIFRETELTYADRLRVVGRRAAHFTGDGVSLDDGTVVRADSVVVATGNPAPAEPVSRPGHPDYIGDPWAPGVLDAIPADTPVLLIGSGLTAVDAVLTLTAGRDRDAPITAVSRGGMLPLTHAPQAAPPVGIAYDKAATLRAVVREVRATAARTGDWRAVVDGVRPYVDKVWTSWTQQEQESFLRHLARPWECHRHRMAPSVGRRIDELRADGRFEVRGGGVRSMTAPPAGGLLVELEADVQWFGAVINCAGPGRMPVSAGGFAGNLLAGGLARVGPHGLGLDIDAAGRLIDASGRAQERLWLLGPLRRGAVWETTAVPEIRGQAASLASSLAARVPVAG
jgi:uncharacterized NAD(P)/FAD-binding protein YdhS